MTLVTHLLDHFKDNTESCYVCHASGGTVQALKRFGFGHGQEPHYLGRKVIWGLVLSQLAQQASIFQRAGKNNSNE